MNARKVLVTGGAGFIGSHLVDALMKLGYKVRVIDDLSQGKLENVSRWEGSPGFEFVKGDVTEEEVVLDAVKGCDAVFHLAANPEVRIGDPRVHFKQNVYATYVVLEAMRANSVKKIVFTSSSTVYGDASVLPTPEDYSPLIPISMYGACKLASESLITGYSKTFDISAVILRLANIVGSRSRHGVIVDFIKKLRKNPNRLEVLGDGEQTKSYLLVDECVEAILRAFEAMDSEIQVYNVGSEDAINVKRIAEIVIEELKLKDVKITYTGGIEGRGWLGDVKKMWLDISKIKKLGWKPRHSSSEAVRLAARALKKEV
ncbi:MAG: SDR family NAD(P)-dependent oxidoreductase [Thaumarchaeota archaeon]|nr:SDR family NAD(P)-dependent oxidoreductase [Nitrososphaerota archaeon]